jgi:hypothetical protein
MARYVAKNVVAAGLAEKCLVQLAYAIGVAEPVSVLIDTSGTGKVSDERLSELVRAHFKLTPKGIIETLDLRRPIYRKTAAFSRSSRGSGRTKPTPCARTPECEPGHHGLRISGPALIDHAQASTSDGGPRGRRFSLRLPDAATAARRHCGDGERRGVPPYGDGRLSRAQLAIGWHRLAR